MEQIIGWILFGLIFSSLWVLVSIEYRTQMVDITRQRIFRIRDLLFDDAVSGKVPIDSKAYRITRDILNANIRFAHDLSFFRLIVMYIQYKSSGIYKSAVDGLQTTLESEINIIDEPAQNIIRKAVRELHETIVLHIVKASLFLRIVVIILAMVIIPIIIIQLIGKHASLGYAIIKENLKIMLLSFSMEFQAWPAVDLEARYAFP